MAKLIVIIGAGPIGLEAALLGVQKGFDVTVLEAGHIAENVTKWGHVRLFSPFEINSSTWGRNAIGDDLPTGDAILTGREFLKSYLQPLSRLVSQQAEILEQNEVQSVARSGLWKGDSIGDASRLESPFRLLVIDRDSNAERVLESDFVFDCSGVYGNHGWLGAGGIPAIGERATSLIDYELPDVAGSDSERYANRRVLVVGSGYSAVTTIVALTELRKANPTTKVTWITRQDTTRPLPVIENDSLPERQSLTTQAMAAIENDVDWRSGCSISRIERIDDGLGVTVHQQGGETSNLHVDRIVANVGFRPDTSIYQELQVHQCYASEGPLKLAASLMAESSNDCLTQTSPGPKTLMNPEPGFLILGAKSYGRDSRFLLRIGIEQVAAAYSLIETEWS